MPRKAKYTHYKHEVYLNDFYAEKDQREVMYEFLYLTADSRPKRVSRNALLRTIIAGRMGTTLRRLDPVAFTCSFNDHITT